MLRLCAVLSLALVAPLPALAYTQQDADTCTPDAFRLCQNFIPDEARVAHCLAANKQQLSPACHAVFSRPATAGTPTTTGAAGQRAPVLPALLVLSGDDANERRGFRPGAFASAAAPSIRARPLGG